MLLPVYQVAGRDPVRANVRTGRTTSNGTSKIDEKFTSEALAGEIVKKDPKASVIYCEDPKKIKSVVEEVLSEDQSPAVVVMMGAGDVVRYTKLLTGEQKS